MEHLGAATLGILAGAALTSIILGTAVALGAFGVEPHTLQDCLERVR